MAEKNTAIFSKFWFMDFIIIFSGIHVQMWCDYEGNKKISNLFDSKIWFSTIGSPNGKTEDQAVQNRNWRSQGRRNLLLYQNGIGRADFQRFFGWFTKNFYRLSWPFKSWTDGPGTVRTKSMLNRPNSSSRASLTRPRSANALPERRKSVSSKSNKSWWSWYSHFFLLKMVQKFYRNNTFR